MIIKKHSIINTVTNRKFLLLSDCAFGYASLLMINPMKCISGIIYEDDGGRLYLKNVNVGKTLSLYNIIFDEEIDSFMKISCKIHKRK